MSSVRLRSLIRLAAAGFATAGVCAPAAAGFGADSPVDACSLLSANQIAQITGFAVRTGVRKDEGRVSNGAYSSTCVWWGEDAAGGRPNFAILNAMTWPAGHSNAGQFLQSFRDAARDGVIGRDPVPLNHLGDEALWWGDGVAVRADNVSFGVSVWIRREPSERRRPMEEALAKAALQSLR